MILLANLEVAVESVAKFVKAPLAQVKRIGVTLAASVAIGSAACKEPTGDQNAAHFANQRFGVGQVFNGFKADRDVEGLSQAGELRGIALHIFDVRMRELRAGDSDCLGRNIDPGYRSRSALGQQLAAVPDAAGDIQHTKPAASLREEFVTLPVLGLEHVPLGGSWN